MLENINMIKQRTLKHIIQATGVGLHTGKKIYLTLRPAPVHTGIVFIRTDLDPVVIFPAKAETVGDTMLATTLVQGKARISTVEHLMSALAGLGIDNAYIEITAPELPIMDGSAAPFVFLIQSAGIELQNAAKKFIRIKEKVLIEEGQKGRKDYKYASLEPFDGFRVDFEIEYKHPLFKPQDQIISIDFSQNSYSREISRARTYGFVSDYEYLRSKNLALGGSLENAVVVDEYRVLNEDGLRYRDEFVRHKALDAIGDLYLLGANLIGAFRGFKSGHGLNNQLVRKLLQQTSAWEYVSFDDSHAAVGVVPPSWIGDSGLVTADS
jgi:UDP-3-O-[3-hydroxymyristoyl] N-acetylglucosamine deacetylase